MGAFLSGRLEPANWYTQLRWQHPVTERNDFVPGDRVSLDIGTSYPFGKVQVLAQLNVLWREKDTCFVPNPQTVAVVSCFSRLVSPCGE